MRLKTLFGILITGCCIGSASAATVTANITSLSTPGDYLFSFSVSGVSFAPYEALDVSFPAAQYSSLSNPTAGSGFSAFVLQPNSPLGVPGDYIAEALVNGPSLASPFTVAGHYTTSGDPRTRTLSYEFDQYTSSGDFVGIVSANGSPLEGNVVINAPGVPEPGTAALMLLGLAAAIPIAYRRRRHVQ